VRLMRRKSHFPLDRRREAAAATVMISAYARVVTLFSDMLRRDRERQGLRLARAAWLLGLSVRELRELEAGEAWPSSDTYVRIGELYGWPQAFVGHSGTAYSGSGRLKNVR
jgi:ribosome-binding protein aMBF1 (putative translation factor)